MEDAIVRIKFEVPTGIGSEESPVTIEVDPFDVVHGYDQERADAAADAAARMIQTTAYHSGAARRQEQRRALQADREEIDAEREEVRDLRHEMERKGRELVRQRLEIQASRQRLDEERRAFEAQRDAFEQQRRNNVEAGPSQQTGKKRRRVGSARNQSEKVTYTLVGGKFALPFTRSRNTRFEGALEKFAHAHSLEPTSLRLAWDDRMLGVEETPAEVGLEEVSELRVYQLVETKTQE